MLIVVSLTNYIFLSSSEQKALEKERWVEHTYQVIGEAANLLRYLTDAETG